MGQGRVRVGVPGCCPPTPLLAEAAGLPLNSAPNTSFLPLPLFAHALLSCSSPPPASPSRSLFFLPSFLWYQFCRSFLSTLLGSVWAMPRSLGRQQPPTVGKKGDRVEQRNVQGIVGPGGTGRGHGGAGCRQCGTQLGTAASAAQLCAFAHKMFPLWRQLLIGDRHGPMICTISKAHCMQNCSTPCTELHMHSERLRAFFLFCCLPVPQRRHRNT